MSEVQCCLCGEWTADDLDRDMSTIMCRSCEAEEAPYIEDVTHG